MSGSREVMDLALALAEEGFEDRVTTLMEAAHHDRQVLADAAHALTTRSAKAGTPEHVAFTYLSAAFFLSIWPPPEDQEADAGA